jgi:general secretion pathway protein B
MSFILDELKKSEMERQRQAAPGLMEAHVARRPRAFPLWALALAVLLAVNLVVLVFVFTRGGGTTTAPALSPLPASGEGTKAADNLASGERPPGPRNTAAATARARAQVPGAAPDSAIAQSAAPAGGGQFSPMDGAPVYAPEIPPAELSAPPAGRAAAPPAGATASRAARTRDSEMSDADAKAESEVLPSIAEVNLTDEKLPELHLDVHVYATRPADRFVYINNRRYREGATLAEGPAVERIRRDGVILSYHSVRFLLPRQ